MQLTRLEALLCKHEGLKTVPYRCPAGRWTIGVGRNIEDRPLTLDEQLHIIEHGMTEETAHWLLRRDVQDIDKELRANVRAYTYIDDVRQDVILSMAYNMGVPRLMTFRRMFQALADHDFDAAAREMLLSKWAGQVGKRAKELAAMMRTGRYPSDGEE